jgi:hypothetical protein
MVKEKQPLTKSIATVGRTEAVFQQLQLFISNDSGLTNNTEQSTNLQH